MASFSTRITSLSNSLLVMFYKTMFWKLVNMSALIMSGVRTEFTRQIKPGDKMLGKENWGDEKVRIISDEW